MTQHYSLGTYKYVREPSGRFSSFKAKVRRAYHFTVRWTLILGVLAGVGYGSWIARGIAEPVQAYEQKVVKEVVTVTQPDTLAPVLARIAQCESHNKQFNADGSVITNTNTNGTVDLGKYQINMNAAHLKEMAKLGLNPLTEEGNTAYAKYIYENHGTSDWASSQHCWYR